MEIVDPDPHKIYSRRKEQQTTSTDLSNDSEESEEFPSTGWKWMEMKSLEKLSLTKTTILFQRVYSA